MFATNADKYTEPNSLCFTFCQIPVVYSVKDEARLEIVFADGKSKFFDSLELDRETSLQVFQRKGDVQMMLVSIRKAMLKD